MSVETTVKTVDVLFEETGKTVEDIAELTNLEDARVEAIALGRWTPSPAERAKIAEAFGVSTDEVSWGHTLDPRNIRYRRFGLHEDF
jgi:transcriptional regulator with XRE-family HTH domain